MEPVVSFLNCSLYALAMATLPPSVIGISESEGPPLWAELVFEPVDAAAVPDAVGMRLDAVIGEVL